MNYTNISCTKEAIMQFQFNRHTNLEGLHAPFSPSQPYWLRYDDEKIAQTYRNKMAADRGTQLHEWAKKTIDLGIKQPTNKKSPNYTLYSYVNDAIGFRMKTEVVLFYSLRSFGTADAISFRDNFLRIHDLKTGVTPVHMEQLLVYAALFCLEYNIKPGNIEMELRIYQNGETQICNPTAEDILPIMDWIVHINKIADKVESKEV